MVISIETTNHYGTAMTNLLKAYLNNRTLKNALKIRAYSLLHPMALCMMTQFDTEMFNDALLHVERGSDDRPPRRRRHGRPPHHDYRLHRIKHHGTSTMSKRPAILPTLPPNHCSHVVRYFDHLSKTTTEKPLHTHTPLRRRSC